MFKVFKSSGIESTYSVSTNPLFSTDGWTIYPLKHKTSKKQCSVWIFDKKKFENAMNKLGVINKSNKQLILDDCFQVLKNYVSSLVRLKHPSILQVLEPLEDHKSRALFVTEYVLNNLVKMDKQELDEIMITKGLLQVSQGVTFLHETLQSVHLNIQPSTIFINENFDWKLSGLNFLQNIETGSAELDTFDPRMPGFVNVNFRFSSPDLILNRKLSFQHDLFSIGCLIFYLFNSKNVNSSTRYIIGCENNNITEYERDVKKLDNILHSGNMSFFRNIPENYLQSLIILLNYQQNQWDINQFTESNIFNNELIKILNFFDLFLSQNLEDQYKFLTKFKVHALEFPKMLLLNKFLPILCDLLDTYTKDSKKKASTEEESLITIIIENIFLISQTLSQLTFMEKVFPRLNQAIQAQGLTSSKIIIINNLSTIEKKLGINENNNSNFENFGKFLITLFKSGIVSTENNQQQLLLQERILSNLKTFVSFQNYNTISNVIFPDICQLFSKTISLKIKNLTINSFVVLLKSENNSLDNFTITEKLLPIIHNTSPKNFSNSDFLKNIISLYDEIFTKLSQKNDSTNFDIILEQIFFQLWKLMRHTKNVNSNEYLISTIKRIEKFLITKSSENLTVEDNSVRSVASPRLSSTFSVVQDANKQQEDNDEEFADFTLSTVQPATRLQLKPTNQSTGLSFGAIAPTTAIPSRRPQQLTPKPRQQVNTANTPQQLTPKPRQQVNTVTTPSSQVYHQPTQIDWSVSSKNSKTTNSNTIPIMTPNNTQLYQQPLPLSQLSTTNNVTLPPGFSMGIIQPTKKLDSSSVQHNYGDSLI